MGVWDNGNPRHPPHQVHRIMEWFRLEGTLRIIKSNHKLHYIIFNFLFVRFTKRKNFGNEFLQPDSLYNSVIYLSFIFILAVLHTCLSNCTLSALCKYFVFSSTCFSSNKRYVLAECVWSTWNRPQMLPRNFSFA